MKEKKKSSKERLADLHQAFNYFLQYNSDYDPNNINDASISLKSLATVLKEQGVFTDLNELKEMIAAVDFTQTGSIQFQEFVSMMNNKYLDANQKEKKKDSKDLEKQLLTRTNMKGVFREMDVDNDGYIDVNDLKSIMNDHLEGETFTDQELHAWIASAGVEVKDKISFKVFYNLMTLDEFA